LGVSGAQRVRSVGALHQTLPGILSLTGTSTRTVAVGLLEYITAHEARWTMMMAASIIVSMPVLVLFSFLQRYVISGLVSGAVKG